MRSSTRLSLFKSPLDSNNILALLVLTNDLARPLSHDLHFFKSNFSIEHIIVPFHFLPKMYRCGKHHIKKKACSESHI